MRCELGRPFDLSRCCSRASRRDRMRLLNRSVGASVVLLLGVAACGSDLTASHPSATDSAPTTSATTGAATTTTRPETPSTVSGTTNETDPADIYLGTTTEINRRGLSNGQNSAVRLSAKSHASGFGRSWTAPTGSAKPCLGDHAMFLGVPAA